MAIKLNLKGFIEEKSNKYSQPPGTLAYEGEFTYETFHGQVVVYDEEYSEVLVFINIEELIELLNRFKTDKAKTIWVNVIGLNDVPAIEHIGEYYRISRLLLEDILHVSKHSKVEIKEAQIFAMVQMIYLRNSEITRENLSIFLSENTVITFQEINGDVFDNLRKRIAEDTGMIRRMKSDYLFYVLIDTLVDNYLRVIAVLNIKIDTIEDIIIDCNDINLNDIYSIKKQLLLLKTTAFPLQSIKDTLKRDGNLIMSQEMDPYLNDLKDHIDQLINEISMAREIVSNLFETHMLNVSNDMNKVMTTLTIFSAIFIPLSFLAGVYGMNFDYMPGLKTGHGFYVFIGICLTVAISMILFFKIKKWF